MGRPEPRRAVRLGLCRCLESRGVHINALHQVGILGGVVPAVVLAWIAWLTGRGPREDELVRSSGRGGRRVELEYARGRVVGLRSGVECVMEICV